MAFIENIIQNEININVLLQQRQKNGIHYIEANKMVAITIQRHYRGYYTRQYFLKLQLAATTIQKHWKKCMAKRYNDNKKLLLTILKKN